jgi:hypothetical protein
MFENFFSLVKKSKLVIFTWIGKFVCRGVGAMSPIFTVLGAAKWFILTRLVGQA